MQYQFSDKMVAVKPSAIREILKMSTDPNLISFAAGNPAPDAFPSKEVAEITAKVLAEDPVSVLQYSITEGYPPLRQAMKQMMREHYHVGNDQDELLIVSGAEQACDLFSKVILNEGDVVLAEDPSFVGALNSFRSYGAKLVGIPMEEDGLDLAELEKALQTYEKIKFIYLIPNFQNPTGITMSWAKRKAVYELAVKYNILILEDNPYGDLRIKGESVPAIKTLDKTGHVVYMGSFSKVIAPGLRVGYTVAPQEISQKMAIGKQVADVHTTILAQYICERYVAVYDLLAHIEDLKKIYKRKTELMLGEMDKHFNPKVAYTRPEGGLFIYCTLPGGVDSIPFCQEALKRGVAVVPGIAFAVDEDSVSSGFRLNFSTPSDENIVKGIEILGKLTYEWVK